MYFGRLSASKTAGTCVRSQATTSCTETNSKDIFKVANCTISIVRISASRKSDSDPGHSRIPIRSYLSSDPSTRLRTRAKAASGDFLRRRMSPRKTSKTFISRGSSQPSNERLDLREFKYSTLRSIPAL